MFKISDNNIITMNHGDYFEFPFTINLNDNYDVSKYVLTEDDRLLFAIVEPNQPFEFGVVRKIFTIENLDEDNNVVIHLDSSDTENILPGRYYYEIKLVESHEGKTDKDYITTVVPRTLLYVL